MPLDWLSTYLVFTVCYFFVMLGSLQAPPDVFSCICLPSELAPTGTDSSSPTPLPGPVKPNFLVACAPPPRGCCLMDLYKKPCMEWEEGGLQQPTQGKITLHDRGGGTYHGVRAQGHVFSSTGRQIFCVTICFFRHKKNFFMCH